MEIIVQGHQFDVSSAMRLRAERKVRALAALLKRPVDAVVRFEPDGITRRVEIVLHAPYRRSIVAEARDKRTAAALSAAARRLEVQILRLKRPIKSRRRLGAKPA